MLMGKAIPTYPRKSMVDPMWVIETAQRGGMDVEDFLEEYNLMLPTEDAL